MPDSLTPLDRLQIQTVLHKSPTYEAATHLRDDILRKPLGLALTREELDRETGDTHVVALIDGQVVGSLTLTPLDATTCRTRQVAIAEALQRQGLGNRLMDFAEAWARQQGYARMVLHARLTALEFYQRRGYGIESDLYTEVSIPHYIMGLTL
jgi:GNAT superfamily N-acetyltransferase